MPPATEWIITILHKKNTFKNQFYRHRNSFKYETKANSTELPKHFWKTIKRNIEKPIILSSVIDNNETNRCNLYLTEKYHILTSMVNLSKK